MFKYAEKRTADHELVVQREAIPPSPVSHTFEIVIPASTIRYLDISAYKTITFGPGNLGIGRLEMRVSNDIAPTQIISLTPEDRVAWDDSYAIPCPVVVDIYNLYIRNTGNVLMNLWIRVLRDSSPTLPN